jgi:hypothetical protein
MPLPFQTDRPPLRTDADGVVRIRRTRVTLEAVRS